MCGGWVGWGWGRSGAGVWKVGGVESVGGVWRVCGMGSGVRGCGGRGGGNCGGLLASR